jgi:hypothetical protein
LCGGTAAETLLHPDCEPWIAHSDIRQARALASLICSSKSAIDAYLMFALTEAKALIIRHRAAVLAIANALMIHKTLDAVEIHQVIASVAVVSTAVLTLAAATIPSGAEAGGFFPGGYGPVGYGSGGYYGGGGGCGCQVYVPPPPPPCCRVYVPPPCCVYGGGWDRGGYYAGGYSGGYNGGYGGGYGY